MTIRELRQLLFQIEEQDAQFELWHDGDIIDVAEVIPQPRIPSDDGTVSLLIVS